MIKERIVPIKNYFILGFIILLSIIIVIYYFVWYGLYKIEKMSTPILSEDLVGVKYNELNNYLVENGNAIFYVSVSNDSEIRDFEVKFKKFINKYSLNNSILYLDITSELLDSNTYREIKYKYGSNVPYIVTFNNGNIKSIFNIKYSNYDIDLLKEYFIYEGVIDD